jgi:C4-dicarboxylate transporter/malic acid transport protein
MLSSVILLITFFLWKDLSLLKSSSYREYLLQGGFMADTDTSSGLKKVISSFAPSWFAVVMGTGVLAVTTLTLSARWAWLAPLATTLHYLNFTFFFLLLVPSVLRWIYYREGAARVFQHPGQGAFYATLSLAMLVLTAQALAFQLGVGVALVMWWAAVAVTFFLNFSLLFRLFLNADVRMEHISPAQFIPAVGLVVIPVAGMPLLNYADGFAHDAALLVNIMGLGAGSLLYLGLFCLLLHRHVMAPALPGKMKPALWIHLAPIGWIPVSLMSVVAYVGDPYIIGFGRIIALLMWGAGCWLLIMVSLASLRALRHGELQFSLAWWSFIFPMGAMTTLTLRLAKQTPIPLLQECAVAFWLLMAFLWTVTLVKTLLRVKNGKIFSG